MALVVGSRHQKLEIGPGNSHGVKALDVHTASRARRFAGVYRTTEAKVLRSI